MFVFGHVGITVAAFLLISRKFGFAVDYKYIILGSMLSDIIDKSMGFFFFGNNGRIIAHTLFFAVLLTLIAFRSRNLMLVAGGVWTHIILDRMWTDPQTLLWPFLGSFSRHNISVEWWVNMLFNDAYTYAGEIAGGIILLYIFVRGKYYKPANIRGFLSKGNLKI